MQSFQAANQSQTVTLNPGESIPESELETHQVERNVHGFRNRNSSNRASSCPASSSHADPNPRPPKPCLVLPRQRNDRNRTLPQPDADPIPFIPTLPNPTPQTPGSASANLGGNVPAGPATYYIGDKGGGGGKGGEEAEQTQLIREQHGRREAEENVQEDPLVDPWIGRQAENARRQERERRERARVGKL
jgi:hypothetical protein